MNQYSTETDDIFKKLLSKYLAYWHLVAACLMMGLAGAYLYSSYTEPVYSVTSTLLIQEDRSIKALIDENERFRAQSNYYNITGILESHTLIDSALSNLNMDVSYYEAGSLLGLNPRKEIYKKAPFRVTYDKEHPQPYQETIKLTIIDESWYELEEVKSVEGLSETKQYFFGQKLEGNGYSFTIDMEEPYNNEVHHRHSYQFIINDPVTLTNMFYANLNFEPLQLESSIVKITFKATNLEKAHDFVNMLTSTFIQQNLRVKNHTAQNTVEFINNQIALTSGNLAATEGKLQDFREEQQILDISLIAKQLTDELKVLDQERSIEEVKRRYYDFLQEYISDNREFSEVFGPSALGIEDPILNSLLVELSELHTERSSLLLTTTEKSPSVVAVDQKIQRVKATMEENIKSINAVSEMLINDLNQRISRIERRISQLPSTERELVGLQRMYNITDATFNFLLEKQAEAGIALASNMPDHTVIDPARFDGMVAPKKKLNYIIGLMLGLILPISLLVIRDYFNTKILDKEEIIKALNFPIVGIVPRYKPLDKNGGVEVLIYDQPYSPVTEAFRTIRSNLNFFSPGKKNNLIVVTSTRSGEGKTFTAINLAAVLALSGKPTLYIDADIRKATPNKLTEHMLDVGLSNYLIGRAELADIINSTSYNDNLYIMNSGVVSPNPAELIEGDVMTRLLVEDLREFDYVVVDTSPVGMVADAQSLMAKAKLNIYVLRHNYSKLSDLDFIREYSKKTGIKNMVLAFNDIKLTKQGTGYGYGYGYGLGYGLNTESEKKVKQKVKRA